MHIIIIIIFFSLCFFLKERTFSVISIFHKCKFPVIWWNDSYGARLNKLSNVEIWNIDPRNKNKQKKEIDVVFANNGNRRKWVPFSQFSFQPLCINVFDFYFLAFPWVIFRRIFCFVAYFLLVQICFFFCFISKFWILHIN